MIISAYGVPAITAMELACMLANLGITFGFVNKGKLSKHQGTWPKQIVFPVVFTSSTTFLYTYSKFKSSRVIAFVVDNPFTLDKELGLPLLGAKVSGIKVTSEPFELDDLKSVLGRDVFLTEPKEFTRATYTPYKEVMSKYAESDLGKVHTFLYRIRDVQKRNKVSRLIKEWLTNTKPLKSLEADIQKCCDDSVWNNLKKILDADSVKSLRIGIAIVKNKPIKIDRVARKLGISPFDIRYLLATK